MLTLTAAQTAALASGALVKRDFVHIEARHPETGEPDPAGFYNDVGVIELDGKTYYGSGTLGEASTISAKSDLSIPGLELTLSGISIEAAALVRGKSVSQAPVTRSIGLYDPETRELIGPLIQRFLGFVDTVTIKRPQKGAASTIKMICESVSRAMTLRSTDTRSHESQIRRQSGDWFYKYTDSARFPVYFGRKGPRIKAKK